MSRKPINQHRALTAVTQGRVIRMQGTARWCGSWQWWDPEAERWRAVNGGECKALDVLALGSRPMIEVSRRTLNGLREEFVLTDYGRVTLMMWDEEMGAVTL